MSVLTLPVVTGDEVRDRAVRLFTFLQEYTQLRARTVLATDVYDEVVWLADTPRLQGCFCAALEPLSNEPTAAAAKGSASMIVQERFRFCGIDPC